MWVTLHDWEMLGPGNIPDAALDQHTRRGKSMGRGIEHFLHEGTKLDNPCDSDVYRDEGYRIKRQHATSDTDENDDEDRQPPRSELLF